VSGAGGLVSIGGGGTGGIVSTAGGTSVGGKGGTTGGGGKGGDCGECLIANHCVDSCDGPDVYTGCCACVPPAFNKNTCAHTN
jgi:hypothetical protein